MRENAMSALACLQQSSSRDDPAATGARSSRNRASRAHRLTADRSPWRYCPGDSGGGRDPALIDDPVERLQARLGRALEANRPGSGVSHVLIVLPSYSLSESILDDADVASSLVPR
jgi:hypothetical protein